MDPLMEHLKEDEKELLKGYSKEPLMVGWTLLGYSMEHPKELLTEFPKARLMDSSMEH